MNRRDSLRLAAATPPLALGTRGAAGQKPFDYERNDGGEHARATSEVILCGGAIETPKLLMLSGIGPADHLRTHGIRVRADRPGVGANFQMGPAADPQAVVDATLRVRGVAGLRVADASIMPEVVNAATHAACVMIGKAAELIRTSRRS